MPSRYAVPYSGQGSIYGDEEVSAVAELLRSGAHLSGGEHKRAFEREFAECVGATHAIAVTSCTVALSLATQLIGLQPGDEVIASPISYQSTINSLLDKSVVVRFCDVDPNTLCLDAAAVEASVTPGTRAIYVTHYGGLIADMDAIMSVADAHGITVVEDCAHALGSIREGKAAGVRGHIGCWSFQSLKNISTLGQGGMLTMQDARWAEAAERISAIEPDADFAERSTALQFGPHRRPRTSRPVRHDKNAYTHDCVAIRAAGTNAIMGEPAALVGRIQLARLSRFVDRRREIADRLGAGLATVPGVRLQTEPSSCRHSYHLYTFFIDSSAGINREDVALELEEEGVEIILRYFPLHLLPEWRFRGGRYGTCTVAERIWFEELINLPMYPTLTNDQVDFMIVAVRRAVETAMHRGPTQA